MNDLLLLKELIFCYYLRRNLFFHQSILPENEAAVLHGINILYVALQNK